MGQSALLTVIRPTAVQSTMATPQDPIQLNVFNPPRPYLVCISLKPRCTARTHEVHAQDDDSVFPQGTLVTKSDDDDLQTIFIKQEGGSYIVEASTDPDLVMSTEPFEVRPHLNSRKRDNFAHGDRARLRTSIPGPSRRFSTLLPARWSRSMSNNPRTLGSSHLRQTLRRSWTEAVGSRYMCTAQSSANMALNALNL